MELALSNTGVWALNPNGEVLFRYGVNLDNVCGDYWKKLPGVFAHLSGKFVNEVAIFVSCSVSYPLINYCKL